MSTGNELQAAAVDLLTTMQSKAIERFELELSDLRTTMMTMATCCEQSLERLRDAKWISFEAASRVVTDLSEAAEAERSRASHLSADLETAKRELDEVRAACRTEIGAAKHELDSVRTQCEMEIAAARKAALHYRDETAAFTRELNAAHELAASAKDAEASMREELNAMQARNQEIVDAQTLRLVELKRELERASAEADRARAAAELANREAVAKLAQQAVLEHPRAVEFQPRPVEANRNLLTPKFEAIEAVLAGNPPAAAWKQSA
jgi:DNA repair exonuclease SbcCD ATPase subunit